MLAAQSLGAHDVLVRSQMDRAEQAGLSWRAVMHDETGTAARVSSTAVARLQAALDAGDVGLTPKDGGGVGVRVKRS